MLPILLEVLPEAIAIAFNPVAVVTIILLLTGKRGRPKSVVYIAGWFIGLLLISMAIYFFMDYNRGPTSLLGRHLPTLQLLLGVQFLGLGVYEIFLIRRQKQGHLPRAEWFKRLDNFTLLQVFILGVSMAALSSKNVGLVLSAGASLLGSGLFVFAAWTVFVLFIALGSAPILVPVIYAFIKKTGAEARLSAWRDWLLVNNAVVMLILFVVMGVKLLRAGLMGI